MERCYVYVDGAYVRNELRSLDHPDEFNPVGASLRVRGLQLLPQVQWGLIPIRVFYYDAIDESRADEADRQRAYFDRLRRLDNTHVVVGEVRQGDKKRREQKGVDVQLAVDALEVAFSQRVAAIALLTGDADFVPLVEAIRRAGPHVIILAFERSLSTRLRAVADRFLPLKYDAAEWAL